MSAQTLPRREVHDTDLTRSVLQAGSDTAAITLSHLWYFLHSNPRCLKRLCSEIDETFPGGEDSVTDLARQTTMPYLNACM